MHEATLRDAGSDLASLKTVSLSSLRDTLTSRSHSKDFAFTRGDYLRGRVMALSAVFLALLPLWTLLDWIMLPSASMGPTAWARLAMVVALGLTFLLARYSKARLQRARVSAGLVLATPAAFYAFVLATLPEGGTLVGYSFIPFMLVTMLAIFPFTLMESAVLGTALIIVEVYALHVGGILMTAAGAQNIWLLVALLSIAIAANYFQLGLMLRLYREATHDPLTGLLNRGALHRAMEQLTIRDHVPPLALLMMDLDHFKRINDEHGHAIGDDVLRKFAAAVAARLGAGDLGARYGGEEFVAILSGRDKQAAMAVAEDIRQQTEALQLTDHEGRAVRCTVSIGVATFQPGEQFHTAALRADERLYEAKKNSRNCVVGV